jgi:hypothetical protein
VVSRQCPNRTKVHATIPGRTRRPRCGWVKGDSPSVSALHGHRRAVWEQRWECGFLKGAKLRARVRMRLGGYINLWRRDAVIRESVCDCPALSATSSTCPASFGRSLRRMSFALNPATVNRAVVLQCKSDISVGLHGSTSMHQRSSCLVGTQSGGQSRACGPAACR